MAHALSEEMVQQLWTARETIRSVINSQRGEMTDLAVIALQDACIDIGDIVLRVRQAELAELEVA